MHPPASTLVGLIAAGVISTAIAADDYCALPEPGKPIIYADKHGKLIARFPDGQEKENVTIVPIVFSDGLEIPTILVQSGFTEKGMFDMPIPVQICEPKEHNILTPIPQDMNLDDSSLGIPDRVFQRE